MSITVNEIRNKEFTQVARGGFNCDEVDDFLDALAEQTEKLVRDNVALSKDLKKAGEDLAAAQAETAALREELEKAQANARPAYNEEAYIKNLETTLRETLVNAQRIADETVAEANKNAETIVSEAEAKAKTITEEAEAQAAEAKAQFEALKAAAEEYRQNFNKLIEGQAQLLKDNPIYA